MQASRACACRCGGKGVIMKYSLILEMDNEKGENCVVAVTFRVDDSKGFDGVLWLHTNNPLYHNDLSHLEQFIVQKKDRWLKVSLQ